MSLRYSLSAFTLALCLHVAQLSAQTPPANDEPAGAVALPVTADCGDRIAGSTKAATASGLDVTCEGRAASNDVFYRFTATAELHTISYSFASDTGNVGLLFHVLNAADLSPVACRGPGGTGGIYSHIFSGLTIGSEYILQVYNKRSDSAIDFGLCLTETPACRVPVLGVESFNIGARHALVLPTLDITAFDSVEYRVLSSFPPNPDRDTPDTILFRKDGERFVLWKLQPATQYSVYARGYCPDGTMTPWSQRRSFRTEADGPVPFDNLSTDGARTLGSAVVRCVNSPYTTRGATADDRAAGTCGGEPDDDIWFRVRPSQSDKFVFEMSPAEHTSVDLVAEYYDGTGVFIGCANAGGAGEAEVLRMTGLQIGDDYTIRVYTAEVGAAADFTACGYFVRPTVANTLGCSQLEAVRFDGSGRADELINLRNADGATVLSMENTEDLGLVGVSYFGATGARSFSDTEIVYTSRNIAVVPERQPTSPVLVRLYLSAKELVQLVAAGVAGNIDDVVVAKVATPGAAPGSAPACAEAYTGEGVVAEVEQVGTYGNGFYVDVRVASFSEFFFAGGQAPLTDSVGVSAVHETATLVEEGFRLAPNPARESVTLSLQPVMSNALAIELGTPQVTIMDATGRKVGEWVLPKGVINTSLDLGQLSAGIYAVEVRAGGTYAVARLMMR